MINNIIEKISMLLVVVGVFLFYNYKFFIIVSLVGAIIGLINSIFRKDKLTMQDKKQ